MYEGVQRSVVFVAVFDSTFVQCTSTLDSTLCGQLCEAVWFLQDDG